MKIVSLTTSLVQYLSGNSTNPTLKQRAVAAATRIILAQEQLVNGLQQDLMNKQAALETLLDVGPDTSDSLRPTKSDFDPVKLVQEVHELELEIVELNVKVRVASERLDMWSKEGDETEQPISSPPPAKKKVRVRA
jgi:hypothetical protein